MQIIGSLVLLVSFLFLGCGKDLNSHSATHSESENRADFEDEIAAVQLRPKDPLTQRFFIFSDLKEELKNNPDRGERMAMLFSEGGFVEDAEVKPTNVKVFDDALSVEVVFGGGRGIHDFTLKVVSCGKDDANCTLRMIHASNDRAESGRNYYYSVRFDSLAKNSDFTLQGKTKLIVIGKNPSWKEGEEDPFVELELKINPPQ
jgi:hypothetical protein